MSSRLTATIAPSTVAVTTAASSFMAIPQFRAGRAANIVQAAGTDGLEPGIPGEDGSNARPAEQTARPGCGSDRRRADQPVPGDQGGEFLLGQAVRARRAAGEDQETVL